MAEKIKESTILLLASGSVGRSHVREVFPALSLTSNALSQARKPEKRVWHGQLWMVDGM